MKITQYLDSTYLKTASQAGITENETLHIVKLTIQEAIENNFKLVMLRPEFVTLAQQMITDSKSKVTVGTVIDFPLGQNSLEYKLTEALKAIENGVDDLDFVINYKAFKQGEVQKVKKEILACTQLGIQNNKIVKWIIEVAALTNTEIIQLSALIKNVVVAHFKENQYKNIFVKSSTGFYKTENGKPNGATIETIKIMLENACPLPVKAAGGVRSYKEAVEMIQLGVKRIGTSSAKAIAHGESSQNNY